MKSTRMGVGHRVRTRSAVVALAMCACGAASGQVTDTKIPLNYNFRGYGRAGEAIANSTAGNADAVQYRAISDRGLYFDLTDTHAFGTLPIVGATGITYSLFNTLGYTNTTAANAASFGLDSVHLSNRVYYRGFEINSNSVTSIGIAPSWAPIFDVTSLSSDGTTATGTTASAHGFTVGQVITIVGASPAAFSGNVTITAVPDATTFQYACSASGAAAGAIFSNSTSTAQITNLSISGATATGTTGWQHGFTTAAPNNVINITGSSDAGYLGQWTLASVPTTSTFTFTNLNAPATTPTGTQIIAATCMHDVDQVTTLAAPVTLDANSEIGVLYTASDGSGAIGGSFDVVLTFSDATTVTTRLQANDWTNTTAPNIISNLVSSQQLIRHTVSGTTSLAFRGLQNVDSCSLLTFGSSNINVIEGIISVPNMTAAGINVVGKTLTKITFKNAFSNPVQITALTLNGSQATATIAGTNNPYVVGQPIVISGVNGTTPSVNGSYKITSISGGTTFTFDTTATGTPVAKMFCNGLPVTSITLAAATGAVTLDAPGQTFAVGDRVTITGGSVAAANGTFTVASVTSATSFTYKNNGSTGTMSAQMQVTRPGQNRGYQIHAATVRKGTAINPSCATAVPIPATNGVGTTINGSSAHAIAAVGDPATSSCGTSDTAAVYYSYVATGTNPISLTTCAPFNNSISVYTGSCGSLTSVACNASNTANCGGASLSVSSSVTINATAGQLYYIRVAGQNGGTGNFSLTVQDLTFVNCSGAVPIGTGDTFGSTISTPGGGTTPCGGGADSNAVWFQYTATGTDAHLVEARTCWDGQNATLSPTPLISGVTGVRPSSCSNSTLVYPLDTTLAVYPMGQCGQPSPTPIACNDNGCSVSSRLQWNATPGTTYLIRVASKTAGYPTGGTPASGPTGPFVLHIDDPVHVDLAMPLAFNWNGICHGTRTVNDANFFSEQCVSTPAIHENRADYNGYRAISDRGLLFDPNNATPNAFNYGGTIGYQGMQYQVYGTALQKDLVHVAQAANPYRGAGWEPNTTTWATPATTNPERGWLPLWLEGNAATGTPTYDHYSNVLSNVSAMNAVFGDNTKLGLIYHMTNLAAATGSFRVTLTFADSFQAQVTCNGTDWFGGTSATPCGASLPSTFPAGVERHRVLGVYNAVQNYDRALAAPTGQLKVVESIISTASLTAAGLDPRGHGILTSIKFDNVTSTDTSTNVSVFAATLRDPLSYNFTNGPSAVGTVTPNQLNAGGTGTMNVTVTLGSAPSNTISSVIVDATAINLGSAYALNVVPGSGTTQWSRLVSFPVNTTPNSFSLPFVATDVQNRQATGNIIFSVVAPTGAIAPNPAAQGATVKATFVFGTAGGISTIVVDGGPIGLGSISLNDGGTGGDATASDGTWSADFVVPAGTIPADYQLPFVLTDTGANQATGNLLLTVTPPSGACCTNTTGACAVVLSTACTGTSSVYNGDFTTCQTGTPSPSCPLTGICCTSSTGACALLYGGSCATTATLGTGTTCDAGTPSTSCPVSQSCCNATTGACTFIYGGLCPAGTTASGGTTCDVNTCPASGTCCNNSTGACTLVYGGNACGTGTSAGTGGIVCGAGTCPVVAVCCNGTTGVCTQIYGGLCPAGTNLASGTTCDGNTTCPAVGTCCNPATGACTLNYSGSCTAPLTFASSIACNPNPCSAQPHTCENFDGSGSLPTGWTTSSTGAGTAWAILSDQSHSPSNAVFTNDPASVSSQFLVMPAVTAAGTLTLDLWSYFSTESTFDGWVVEYSTDGGNTWTDVGAGGWALNGYNVAAISATFSSPIAGRPAFSGVATTWTERIAAIPANPGDSVIIRFQMASDTSVSNTGVWLDDICVAGIQVASPGVCCRGSTCSTAFADAAACAAALDSASITVQSKFVTGAAACNTPVTIPGTLGNITSPCCYANYNHNTQLEVQDIFDFLNDWFAGKKAAIVGGDGTTGTLAVQNIFDFLNSWFAGGCN